MEFWGAEVKVGETLKVDPMEFDACIHLSQAALGESKKDKANESVVIFVKVGEQKLVLGTLLKDKIPQISLELVLDKEFELSHNSKTASVHFCGYKALYPENDDSEEDDFTDSDEEEIPLAVAENGKPETKAEDLKVAEPKKANVKSTHPAKNAAPAAPAPSKPAPAKPAKQVKLVDPKEESDDDDESDEDDEIGSSDDEMEDADSDEVDEDDSDEEDEEETPVKKVEQGKKRSNESASKTPVPSKKTKNSTPEKTDGKKAVHTATPHPKKGGGKTPTTDAKSPKSGGQLTCGSCSKTFNSETGLQQHSKAKHGAQ